MASVGSIATVGDRQTSPRCLVSLVISDFNDDGHAHALEPGALSFQHRVCEPVVEQHNPE